MRYWIPTIVIPRTPKIPTPIDITSMIVLIVWPTAVPSSAPLMQRSPSEPSTMVELSPSMAAGVVPSGQVAKTGVVSIKILAKMMDKLSMTFFIFSFCIYDYSISFKKNEWHAIMVNIIIKAR